MRAESGDMRSVLSSIQDTSLAVGLEPDTRDEHGDPLGVNQVVKTFSWKWLLPLYLSRLIGIRRAPTTCSFRSCDRTFPYTTDK